MYNRRMFLAGAAGAAAHAAHAASPPRDVLADLIVVNALGNLTNPNLPVSDAGKAEAGRPAPLLERRTVEDARASGMTAINVTVDHGTTFDGAVHNIRAWEQALAEFPDALVKIGSAAAIKRAKADRKLGLIFGFQNAAMVEDKAEHIDTFAGMGVKIIQLTYNSLNQLGGGSLAPGNVGLTAFGHEVVARLNANKVMVDLSHSGERICLDAAKASTQPISINHTGCRALANSPRNKTDEELRAVASRGGFIGIYFMPFVAPGRNFNAEDVLAHIDHAVNVCGEDHVGIGTDNSITAIDDTKAYMADYARQIAERRAAGISAPGEDPNISRYPVDMVGPDQFRVLYQRMTARKYSARRIEKIMGGNFVRYATDVWGA